MNIDKIIRKVENYQPKPMDNTRKYAVMIPIIFEDDQWKLIYEFRALDLVRQPGEISFPGGRVEKGETFKQAAIRETMEELLIERKNINLIGELDYLVSKGNYTIYCFFGIIMGLEAKDIKPSKDEVDHIFTVPLKFLLNNKPDEYFLDLETRRNEEFPYNLIPNGEDYKFNAGKHSVLFYKYGEYNIWGYTAKMTRHFINIIKDLD